jgi:hypothetical protein
MAAKFMLLQRARFHEGEATCGTGVLACACMVFVVQLDGVRMAAKNETAQLEKNRKEDLNSLLIKITKMLCHATHF